MRWAEGGGSEGGQGLLIKLTQDASRGQGAGGEVTVWHSLVYVEMGAILGHRVVQRDKKKNQNKINKKKTGTVMTSPETERLSGVTGWCQTLVIFLGAFFVKYCMSYSFFSK